MKNQEQHNTKHKCEDCYWNFQCGEQIIACDDFDSIHREEEFDDYVEQKIENNRKLYKKDWEDYIKIMEMKEN